MNAPCRTTILSAPSSFADCAPQPIAVASAAASAPGICDRAIGRSASRKRRAYIK
jgi:hypothetical protein